MPTIYFSLSNKYEMEKVICGEYLKSKSSLLITGRYESYESHTSFWFPECSLSMSNLKRFVLRQTVLSTDIWNLKAYVLVKVLRSTINPKDGLPFPCGGMKRCNWIDGNEDSWLCAWSLHSSMRHASWSMWFRTTYLRIALGSI